MARVLEAAKPALSRPHHGLAELISSRFNANKIGRARLMSRLVSGLIAVFLVVIALVTYSSVEEEREARRAESARAVLLLASVADAALSGLPTEAISELTSDLVATRLKRVLPVDALAFGRQIIIASEDGTVMTRLPPVPLGASTPPNINTIMDDAALVLLAAEGGAAEWVDLADGTAIAAYRSSIDNPARILVYQHENNALGTWTLHARDQLLRFLATAFVTLLLGYAYLRQAGRAERALTENAGIRAGLNEALKSADCGIWDWDIGRGQMFWSESMFKMLGRDHPERMLSFTDAAELIHPDDMKHLDSVDAAIKSGKRLIERTIRVRHADGHWVWLRTRGEVARDIKRGGMVFAGLAIDVSEQCRLAERSERADLRLRDAIEAISEAFVVWDSRNRLVLCNSKYREFHNLPPQLVRPGTPYEEIVAAADQPHIRSLMADGTSELDHHSAEAQLDNGCWLQINERRTKDGGFVSVGTDVTDLKKHGERLVDSERRLMATIADLRHSRQTMERQTRQLQDLADKYAKEKERAEQASHAKSKFLATMSHELRTPLNAIIGFSEVMISGLFGSFGSDKYKGYCEDIHKSGQFLLDVINDILDMARIEEGLVRLNFEDVEASDIVAETLRITANLASTKKITMVTELSEELPLRADKRALKQILLNVLSNAVKFTPEKGRITVRAKNQPGMVCITIEDNGIGIPRSALKTIGRPFEQVENEYTKVHPGSGLGLAISKSLCDRHGGSLRIHSTEHVGTVVTIRLPLYPPEPGIGKVEAAE